MNPIAIRSALAPLFIGIGFAALLTTSAAACQFCQNGGACPFCHADNPIPVGTPVWSIGGGRWDQPGGLGSPITVTYSYNNFLDGGLLDPANQIIPASFLRASVEEGFRLWASVVPIHFVEVPDQMNGVTQGAYPNGQFGQIRFNHTYINGPDILGQPPTTKAFAYYPQGASNIGGDIFFDNSDRWAEVGTQPTPDIMGIATHEIGHALGLGHSDDPGATMYWIARRFGGLGTGSLSPDDTAGMRAIYGAGVGSVTPLAAVPEPSGWLILSLLTAVYFAGKVEINAFARSSQLRN